GPEAREALHKLAQGTDQLPAEERLRLLGGLAVAYGNAGEHQEAQRLWGQLAAGVPNDLAPRVLLFDQAVRAGDVTALERLVQEIKKIEGPNGAMWRYAEAARLVALARKEQGTARKEHLGAARLLLNEVVARRRSWSRVPVLEGEIALLEANP